MADTIGRRIPNDKNLEITLISDFKNTDIKQLALFDAIVLDYTDTEGCSSFLRQIRASFIGTLYLMPVFIMSLQKEIDPLVESMSDGVISTVQVDAIVSKIERIKAKQNTLSAVDSATPDIRIMTKVLRQLYTRDGRLVPVIDAKAHTGYNYPMLSEHYHNGNTPEMYKLLQNATEREYLRPKFIDKLHLCSNCYSAFINFRETCPKCESTDLVTENLIHHFVCAYVGPEHDFLSGDYMVCPKCNRLLRHIGVDYDKPSLIYNCRNCANLFQEPVMEAFCFSCHKRNPVEALIDMPVYSYELTAIGEETAQNGFSRDIKEEFELPGYITFTTFNIFLKYEIERSKTTNKVSAVGSLILRIANSDKEKMGAGYRKLITEVSDFIKNATLSTDILSFINNNTFLIISPDTDPAKLQTLLQNIQSSVNKLLSSSLPGVQIGFVPKVLSVNANQNHTDMINQLLTA